MERYLITQSLLNSWSYCFDCYEGKEDEAYENFISTLKREPSETTPAMANGIAFENEVYTVAAGLKRPHHPHWENGIQAVASHIIGASVQVKAQREIEIRGMKFLVYGILDALQAGVITDVKFTNTALGSMDVYGKYLGSPQHPAYFYIVPEAREFQYLLSDGEDIYIERYTRGQTPHIHTYIEEFVDSISCNGLLDLYKEKWLAL